MFKDRNARFPPIVSESVKETKKKVHNGELNLVPKCDRYEFLNCDGKTSR